MELIEYTRVLKADGSQAVPRTHQYRSRLGACRGLCRAPAVPVQCPAVVGRRYNVEFGQNWRTTREQVEPRCLGLAGKPTSSVTSMN